MNDKTLIKENLDVARKSAAEGMVLLKNDDNTLPFKKGEIIAPVGKGIYSYLKCGGGSAEVYSAYSKSVMDGLYEKKKQGKIKLSEKAVQLNSNSDVYTDEAIEKIGESCDKVVVSIVRYSGEAFDRKAVKGEYYLSDEEIALFDKIEKCESIKSVVVLFNNACIMDMSFLNKYSKIKSALIIWLPGMEGGLAAADILCGDTTPSGKLCDTIAMDYTDYPSSNTFGESDVYVRYEEDIFVGYRYFETFEKARDKVLFPFGFGLSYTSFSLFDTCVLSDEKNLIVKTNVKNTGNYAGKEVVQVYINAPKGRLDKPFCELKGFKKTDLLEPGQSEKIEIIIDISSLASFDDTGITEFPGCYVMESGVYNVLVGTSIRDVNNAGSIFVEQTTLCENCGLKMSVPVNRRLTLNGELKPYKIDNVQYDEPEKCEAFKGKKIMLQDVANKKASMKQFLAQLSIKELIDLSYSQPPTFARGTAGIGNMCKYGVPNVQTADGPNGLRKTVPTTCFPCAQLIGCSFNEKIVYSIGEAIGKEGIATSVDILLAPGLCIHRDPLCGRNFEYFSEDPVLSGKSAAAYVKGVQSTGMLATIKHFCCNNKEENRFWSNSILSERALREIYLKGFEIAVKTSDPAFVMSSYNFVNSNRTSSTYGLLTGILRNEWGFNGAVMSDWRVPSHQFEEILAGNNIKMPYGYPEEHELTLKKFNEGVISRELLEQNVKTVLNAVMKSDCFKRNDMGRTYTIAANSKTKLSATDFTGVTGTWLQLLPCEDDENEYCLSNTCKDFHDNDVAVFYDVNIESEGDYDIYSRIDSKFISSWLEFQIDGEPVAINGHFDTRKGSEKQNWITIKNVGVHFPKGQHIFSVVVRDMEKDRGMNLNWFEFSRKNS